MAKETRFDRLLREGLAMSAAERMDCVRGLMLDPRFAGLLGFVQGEREEYVRSSCDQALADSHGKQSHAWGSVFALEGLVNAFRGVAAKGAPKDLGAGNADRGSE